MGYFTPVVHAQGNKLSTAKEELYHIAQDKIATEVKKDLEKDDFVEVLVYMKDQVDTEMVARATKDGLSSSMTPYQTKLQVRRE